MHWIEPYSFCTRYCEVPYGTSEYYPDAEKKVFEEIEQRLGGKIKSHRHTRLSQTGSSSWQYGEALVELK